jgi:hypothetical protein
MGMYTELHYNASLKSNTPISILNTLRVMVGDAHREDYLDVDLDVDFLDIGRIEYMLRCNSYCFDADTHSTLKYDHIIEAHYLCVRCNLKNYDQEIQRFIKWIDPYVDKLEGSFLGFYRYEEDETPTLIYKEAE